MKSALSYRPGRCQNEASRRLHRGALETAQKLELSLNQVTSFTDLFSPQIDNLRSRLKEYCERLIFTDPVMYGKKAEDLLWRKVFYEFFQKCKQNRKKLLESEFHTFTVRGHLSAAIGLYHHILLRIQTEFHLNLEGELDAPFQWQLKGMKKERWKKYQQTTAADNGIQVWANQAVHRTLIYLGDLARYIAELHEPEYAHMAERYYLQAFCLNYKNGMPHNQLGSLANNKFDSAYHYMRCLASVEKFDGAEGNLKRAFDRNNQVIENLDSSEVDSSSNASRLLGRFLKLCEIFYFSSDENIQSLCHEVLQDFECWMQNSTHASQQIPDCENSSYSLSTKDEIVFKMCVMSLMCRTRLDERGSADVAIATAFILALFSTVVRGNLKRLTMLVSLETESSGIGNETEKTTKFKGCEINGIKELTISENEEDGSIPDMKINKGSAALKREKFRKINQSRLRKLRRRRKMSSTSQEDSELSDIEEPPESDEDNCVLNSDGSQAGSISSESGSEHEDDSFLVEQKNLENENKSEGRAEINETVIEHPAENEKLNKNGKDKILKSPSEKLENGLFKVLLSPENLFEILQKLFLLQSLKVLMDWLKTQPEVIAVCAETSDVLLINILKLLNIVAKLETHLLKSHEKLSHLIRVGNKWQQTSPLPEDILLMHLPILEDIHSHLSFDIAKRRELSPNEQVFLRMQCFLSFGDILTSTSEPKIVYNRRTNLFALKQTDNFKKNSFRKNLEGQEVGTQKQHVMHEMTHLWLKAEVNNLEAIVESKCHPQLSPLLVTDTSALCRHLPLLKQLVAAKKFIVIVPKIVIDSLDQIKKKSIGAREAIRWLEYVFQKGSRHIRAQRDVEKATLYPMKYPKKKEKDSWDFFQILECCHYLVQQQSSGKPAGSMVTLVVGTINQLPSNATALAKSLSVNMENLENFFAKWRSSTKNPG